MTVKGKKRQAVSRASKHLVAKRKAEADAMRSLGWLDPKSARDVAKDLRALAEVFDEPGPGHAAVLRSFAARLDGGKP